MKTLPPLRLNGLPEPRNPAVLVPLEDWPERDPGICWRNEWIHIPNISFFFESSAHFAGRHSKPLQSISCICTTFEDLVRIMQAVMALA